MKDSKKTDDENQGSADPQEIQVEGTDALDQFYKEGLEDGPESPKKVSDVKEEEKKVVAPGKPPKPEMVPFSHFFMYSTAGEKALLYIGYLACGVAGLMIPSVAIFMGEITVSFDPETTTKDTLNSMRRLNIAIQIIGAIIWFFSYIFYSFWQHLAENVSFNLRERYIRKLMDQEIGYFEKQKVEDIPSQIGDIFEVVQRSVGQNAAMLYFSLAAVVGGVSIAFVRGTKFAAAMFILIPFMMCYMSKIFMGIRNAAIAKGIALKDLGGKTEEILANIKVVVSFAREEKELAKFKKSAENLMLKSQQVEKNVGIMIGAIRFLIFGIYAIAFYVGGVFIKEQVRNWYHDKVYDASILLTVVMSLVTGLMNSVGVMPNIQALVTARTKAVPIFQVLLREPEIKDNQDSKTSYTLEKGIKFENVFFRYPVMPDGQPDVLQGVNFTIKSKTSTAIVGPSGSGKSTIVQMIERFYDPKSGSIHMDSLPLKDIKLSTLRESIGYVSQEPVLIMGTIKQNMQFGWCDATEEEMREALRQANALDFVMKLDGGLEAYVGASSMLNLSGGQKQRIAIARALLRKPKILILDEATSALDTKSEDEVQRAIDKIQIENKDLTVIVIAHRLTTIEASDNIIFLEAKNKAVQAAKGTTEYDEVMAKLKAENYAHQKEEEEEDEEDEDEAEFDFNMPRIQAGSSKKGRSQKGSRKGSRGIQEIEEDAKKKQEEEKEKKEEAEKKKSEVKRVVSTREIMKYYEPTWVLILSFIAPAISSTAFPLFGLVFTRILFIIMQPQRDDFYAELNKWTLYFIGVCCLMAFGGMFTKMIYTKGGEKCTYNIREKVFESILHKHVWWFDTQETSAGVISNVLSEKMSKINGMTTESISVLIEAFLTIAIGIMVSCIYSWQVALITLAISPMQILGTFAMARLQWRRGEDEDAYKRSNALLSEIIMNYRTIVGFGAKNIDAIMDEYRSHIYLPNRAAVKKAHISGFFFGYSQYAKFGMIGIIFHLATIVMFEYDLEQMDVYTAVYVIFISSVGTGFNLSQQQNVTEAKVAASVVFDIIDEPSKVDSRKKGEVTEVQKGVIEFKDVEFKYPSRDTMVLQKINFKIQANQSIALVGASGSGKSTIAALLLQFYQQQNGRILIDGKDITDYDIKSLREQIGYVMQEPVLFNDTIKNNILYGKLDATDKEVWQASQQANAIQFIESNIENLSGDKAFKNQVNLLITAVKKLDKAFQEIALHVCKTKDLHQITLFYEILSKGDQKSKQYIKENQELFIQELEEKVKISGFKWDDFVMRFEWIVREQVPIFELLNLDENLTPEVQKGLKKAIEANPEKLDLDLVERFITSQSEEKNLAEPAQEILKKFMALVFEEQKKHGSIKFKRFTELSDNLTATFSGKSLHEGFDKSCGLKGSQLSGGQKQRIAIARALIKKPKILILDEATSALDEHSQEIVQQALDRAMEGRTSIVIAHRLSTIRNCNLIFVVNEGKIAEIGTFKELSNKKGGHFAELKSRMEN